MNHSSESDEMSINQHFIAKNHEFMLIFTEIITYLCMKVTDIYLTKNIIQGES